MKIEGNIKDYRREALEIQARMIMGDYAESVGVVFVEFDCGCMRVCGASANGDPVGPMIMIPGLPVNVGKIPICTKCIKDNGSSNRIIGRGIIWKIEKSNVPDENHKQAILQKAFGHNAP